MVFSNLKDELGITRLRVTGAGGGSQPLIVLQERARNEDAAENGLAVLPDETKAYTSSVSVPGEVLVTDLSSMTTLTTITASLTASIVDLISTADGATVYAILNDGTVVPITTATDTTRTPITLGVGITPGHAARNSTTLYITDNASASPGKVYPFGLGDESVGTPFDTTDNPNYIAVTDSKGYVASSTASEITPFDPQTNTPGTALTFSQVQTGIAFTTNGSQCWAPDAVGNLSVIDASDDSTVTMLVVDDVGLRTAEPSTDGTVMFVSAETHGIILVDTNTFAVLPPVTDADILAVNPNTMVATSSSMYVNSDSALLALGVSVTVDEALRLLLPVL